MLDQWNTEKLMIYCFLNENFDLTPTVGTYTIGPSGNFNTTRPQKIDKAWIRFTPSSLMAYDFPLEIVSTEKYQDIFMKAIQVTYPLYLYYNPTMPTGTIQLWPLPNSACKLGISQWQQISAFANLTTDIELPPGYLSAMAYGLAVEMLPEYPCPNADLLIQKALDTKENLQSVNLELTPLKTDNALYTPKGFNILSGSYR